MKQRTFIGVLLAVGTLLLANPLYLDGLLIYPTTGDGWGIGGHYHAALSGLGLVILLSCVSIITSLPDRYGVIVTLGGIAVATVVLFVGYSWVVFEIFDPMETRVLGYGHRKTFIVSVVASLFVMGGAVAERRPSGLASVPLVLAVGLAFVSQSRMGIEKIPFLGFDLFLLAVKPDILGIPYLGGLFLSTAMLVGGVFSFSNRERMISLLV